MRASVLRTAARRVGGGVPMTLSPAQARALSCAADLARELLALRAVFEGRTTRPSHEEACAHEAAGGWWLVLRPGVGAPRVDTYAGWAWLPDTALRWWSLDVDGRPCAWPVAATEVP